MDLQGAMRQTARVTARRVLHPPERAHLPAGRMISLGERGATFVSTAGEPDGSVPLLLLHALGCTAGLTWFPSVPTLAERHPVVMFDQRWHGRGPRTGRIFRLTDAADDAVAVADVLGIDRFVAVGYSMGGTVAQLLWKRHPDRVAGLVLAATARNFRGSRHESVFFRLLPPVSLTFALRSPPMLHAAALAAGVLDDAPGGVVMDEELSRWAMTELRLTSPRSTLAALSAMGQFSSADWVPDIDVPTAVVVTTKDRAIAPRRQYKLADAIPGAHVFEVAGGHASCVLRADAFVPALAEACDDVVARIPDDEVRREATS